MQRAADVVRVRQERCSFAEEAASAHGCRVAHRFSKPAPGEQQAVQLGGFAVTAQAAFGVVLEDWMQMWVKEERAAEQRPFLWEAPWAPRFFGGGPARGCQVCQVLFGARLGPAPPAAALPPERRVLGEAAGRDAGLGAAARMWSLMTHASRLSGQGGRRLLADGAPGLLGAKMVAPAPAGAPAMAAALG